MCFLSCWYFLHRRRHMQRDRQLRAMHIGRAMLRLDAGLQHLNSKLRAVQDIR
jgi:hypothetical protein